MKALVPLLSGSPEVRFEIVPGGHLGMLTGRAARGTTWVVMDEWITQWSTEREEKAPAKAASTPTAAAIGTNRNRRHSSSASRALKK